MYSGLFFETQPKESFKPISFCVGYKLETGIFLLVILTLSSFKSPSKKETLNKIDTIELRNIDFKYDNSTKLVLDNLSVSFPNNQITGIMGPSGSGKSTLISIVLGLLKPQNGKIIFKSNGEDISKNIPNNIFGYVPQNIFLIDVRFY